VVASREYEEMTLSSLQAFGDGVREFRGLNQKYQKTN
jgi:hypothetical protein